MVGRQSYKDFQIILIHHLSNSHNPPLTPRSISLHPAVQKTDLRKEWRPQQIKYVLKEYASRLPTIKSHYCWENKVEPAELEERVRLWIVGALREAREKRDRKKIGGQTAAAAAVANMSSGSALMSKRQIDMPTTIQGGGSSLSSTAPLSSHNCFDNSGQTQHTCMPSMDMNNEIWSKLVNVDAKSKRRAVCISRRLDLEALCRQRYGSLHQQLPLPPFSNLELPQCRTPESIQTTLDLELDSDFQLPDIPESCILPMFSAGKEDMVAAPIPVPATPSAAPVLDVRSDNIPAAAIENQRQSQKEILHNEIDLGFPVEGNPAGRSVGLGLTLPKIDRKGKSIEYRW